MSIKRSSTATSAPSPTTTGVNSFSGRQEWAQGPDIDTDVAVGTIELPTSGNVFNLTGSVQIETINGASDGTIITLIAVDGVSIGYSGNIGISAGQVFFLSVGETVVLQLVSGVWEEAGSNKSLKNAGYQEVDGFLNSAVGQADPASLDSDTPILDARAKLVFDRVDAIVPLTSTPESDALGSDNITLHFLDWRPAANGYLDDDVFFEVKSIQDPITATDLATGFTSDLGTTAPRPGSYTFATAAGESDVTDYGVSSTGGSADLDFWIETSNSQVWQVGQRWFAHFQQASITVSSLDFNYSEWPAEPAVGTEIEVTWDRNITLTDATGHLTLVEGDTERDVEIGERSVFRYEGRNGSLEPLFTEISSTAFGASPFNMRQVTTAVDAMHAGPATSHANADDHSVSISPTAAANSTGARAIRIGAETTCTQDDGVAVGYGTGVIGTGGISIGSTPNVGAQTIAVGVGSDIDNTSLANELTLVGNAATVVGAGVGLTIIGRNAYANESNSGVVIGHNASSEGGEHNVVVGSSAGSEANGRGNVVMGWGAKAWNSGASSTESTGNVVIGASAKCGDSGATTDNSVAIGRWAEALGIRSTSLGYQSSAQKEGATALGRSANARSIGSVAIGHGATCFDSSGIAYRGVAIGRSAQCGSSSGDGGVAVGYGASTAGPGGISVGMRASADGTATICIGQDITSADDDDILIGDDMTLNRSSGEGTGNDGIIAIGRGLTGNASMYKLITIGHQNDFGSGNHQRGIAIGWEIARTDNDIYSINNFISIGNAPSVLRSVIIGMDTAVGLEDSTTNAHRLVIIGTGASTYNSSGSDSASGVTLIGHGAYIRNAGERAAGVSCGWMNHQAKVCIAAAQSYGFSSINIGADANNRPGTFKIGAQPIVGYYGTYGTNGNSRPFLNYQCGFPSLMSQGPLDMTAVYTGPVRRWWAFSYSTLFFIDKLSLISTGFDTLTTHGNISVTGLKRSSTATTSTAAAVSGSSVAVAVTSETGFAAGDWVLVTTGTLNGVDEVITGLAKVESTAASSIVLDLLADDDAIPAADANLIKMDGTDGNVLASTQMSTITAAKQREILVTDEVEGVDAVVVTRESAATATTLTVIPQLTGALQEITEAWTYN